ncbi:MAG: glycosyltransferase family 4 protein, partial [Clostridiaceae bacterium]|nr:glycosyltransferase family 4 protein [Clostridiaceae bacterium]
MKIYIDVSNLILVNYITGIQRVVREVTTRMLEYSDFDIVLLNYISGTDKFCMVDSKSFYNYFKGKTKKKPLFSAKHLITVEEFEPGTIFFDFDSTWNSPYKRSALLPELKKYGVKIITYIYDIIPVTNPEYCHSNTIYNFLDYLGATLKHSDAIITSTQSTVNELNKLGTQLNIKPPVSYVSWLGSDFQKEQKSEKVQKEALEVGSIGKFILTVGTIEPRKNHKVLLDAFDRALFEEKICLVFAGRIGWNVEEFEKRVKKHPQFGKKLFLLSDLNDASIDYLYQQAFLVAFPTYNEGFGLPMIEAFERKTPVIASDCEVLKEVGGDFCEYFNPDSPSEFIEIVMKYLSSEDNYKNQCKKLEQFVPFTWSQTTDRIISSINDISKSTCCKQVYDELKQIVMLSARCKNTLNTLPFIENFMPFITELVLCCPDSMVNEFKNHYSGRLKVIYITDNTLLSGKTLPADHQTRNFFLRSLMMRQSCIDEAFIMSDDDYRPLCTINPDTFVKDDKYIGYYCYYLGDWQGDLQEPTSYDLGIKNTLAFVRRNGYPERQYSSHMPQVIDKKLYLEFLDEHTQENINGIDEWSGYFNWLQWKYPNLIIPNPYISMCWPGNQTDWELKVCPGSFKFENYYEELYEKGNIFEGFSETYGSMTLLENIKKIQLYLQRQYQFQSYAKVFHTYVQKYLYEFQEMPSITLSIGKQLNIKGPNYIIADSNGFIHLPIALFVSDNVYDKKQTVVFSYTFEKNQHCICQEKNYYKVPMITMEFSLPLWCKIGVIGEVIWNLTVC